MAAAAATLRIRVWDLPTRLCHWTLAALAAGAFVTGFSGGNGMEVHGKAGIAIVALLAFRIVWGFIGSTHARFATFVRGPAAIRAYLRGEWQGVGHNPLGALAVLGLLGFLAIQTATGLFGNDDIAFTGPLYALVDKETSDFFTALHRQSVWLLLLLVVLHLGAIAFYWRVRRQNLVRPMLTGWKEAPAPHAEAARGGGMVALLAAVCIGGFAAYAAAGALLPPPTAAAATTPAW